MLAYLVRKCSYPFLALCLVLTSMGCASSGPQVKVLGVSEARQPAHQQSILVFVEVVNQSDREIRLSRLDYDFRASQWFSSDGQVALSRFVAPGASAVVEIGVPIETREQRSEDVNFTLAGRLYAQDDRLERSWSVKAKGALSAKTSQEGPSRVFVSLASGQ